MNKLIIFLSFLLASPSVLAGDSGLLCTALANPPPWVNHDYIVEVEINPSVARYSNTYFKNNWMPDTAELNKIIATSRVTSVLKGHLKPGDALPADTSLVYLGGPQNGVFWKSLFSQKKITLLTGPTLNDWAGEAYNSSFPVVNMAHVKGYETYKSEIKKCLGIKQ